MKQRSQKQTAKCWGDLMLMKTNWHQRALLRWWWVRTQINSLKLLDRWRWAILYNVIQTVLNNHECTIIISIPNLWDKLHPIELTQHIGKHQRFVFFYYWKSRGHQNAVRLSPVWYHSYSWGATWYRWQSRQIKGKNSLNLFKRGFAAHERCRLASTVNTA